MVNLPSGNSLPISGSIINNMEKFAQNFFGVDVYTIPEDYSKMDVYEQVIFPKRKNKRIQARYKNNKKYWGYVKKRYSFMTANNQLFADELTIEQIRKSVGILEKFKS